MKSEQILKTVIKIPALLADCFTDMSREFEKDHNYYCDWLKKNIKEAFQKKELKEIFEILQIDWLTLHYSTRHMVHESSESGEWIQIGIPLQSMQIPIEKLQAYQSKLSPYISFFKEKVSKSGNPIKILFKKNDNASDATCEDWLCVGKSFVDYVKEITKGNSSEGEFTSEQTKHCLENHSQMVSSIKDVFKDPSGRELSNAEALGLFRDSCRVTFLALQQNIIALPRTIILSPVYVEDNLIGGIAYIGGGNWRR